MPSFNRVILAGHITRDVELRYTPSGVAVADGSLAVNDRYKKGEEYVETVGFFDFTLFGKRAEAFAEYTGKGDAVLLEGKLKHETWEKEGKKNSRVKVTVDDFKFLKSKNGPQQEADSAEDGANNQDVAEPALPF